MIDSLWRASCATVLLLIVTCGAASAQQGHPIPAPWQQSDVGDVGLAGSAVQGPDADLYINGAGSDIWGTADSFHFVYQPLSDGKITSNYMSLENTNPYAKIGLMIRLSLDPGSPEVIIDQKPDNTVEFMTRSQQGGETRFVAGWPKHGDMQLIRRDGIITGIVCSFDNGCEVVGSVAFPSGPALVGVAITSHDPTVMNHGYVAADMPHVSSVPDPWQSYDVGAVGLAGSASYDSGTFTVKGSGADIWGTADAYHAVTAGFSGYGSLIARVTAEDAANIYAKAGIVMTPNAYGGSSPTVILDVRPNGAIEFMARSSANGPMAFIAGTQMSFPVRLKMARIGLSNSFTAFVSSDGQAWQYVGGVQVTMASAITAGLAVTSHDTSAINTSTFDHVTVASQAWTDIDVGAVGAAGAAAFDYSTNPPTPTGSRGAGADIWGNADGFNYLYQSMFGGTQGGASVRITALDNTNTYAKAGLMLRDTSDGSGAHVILDVRPGGQIEFMKRDADGGATTFIAGAQAGFPVYLRLLRTSTTVTGAISSDGVNWTDVGTTSTGIGADAMMGLAVTSHSFGVLATTTFDHLSVFEPQ